MPGTIEDGQRNDELYRLACSFRAKGADEVEMLAALQAVNSERCKPPLDDDELAGIVASASKHETQHFMLPPPSVPLKVAEIFAETFRHDSVLTLRHHRGSFYLWHGGTYRELDSDAVDARLYTFLGPAVTMGPKGPVPWGPNKQKIGYVSHALKKVVRIDIEDDPPFWIEPQQNMPPADRLIIARNCLVDVETRDSLPHDPRLFAVGAPLPYDFDPKAPKPERWLRFLADIWPDDQQGQQSEDTLHEWFGYCLTSDTAQQKVALLIGPPRAGKGVVTRALTAVIGKENVAATALVDLARNFGLQELIHKRVANIADARIGSHTDRETMLARILNISGEDAVRIDRKYQTPWTGKLKARIVISTNEMPKLADASGAFVSRLLVFRFTESFVGREDRALDNDLKRELPGILNLALDGLERLRVRGRFEQPDPGKDVLEAQRELLSIRP